MRGGATALIVASGQLGCAPQRWCENSYDAQYNSCDKSGIEGRDEADRIFRRERRAFMPAAMTVLCNTKIADKF